MLIYVEQQSGPANAVSKENKSAEPVPTHPLLPSTFCSAPSPPGLISSPPRFCYSHKNGSDIPPPDLLPARRS